MKRARRCEPLALQRTAQCNRQADTATRSAFPIAFFLAFLRLSEFTDHCMHDTFQSCWFLTGATAVGKTAVGIALARRLGAEIVSLDSMTVYRGMDIGTAKPTAAEREAVSHHLLDIV